MTSRIDPYIAYRLQLLQEAQTLRSFWEQLGQGEPDARDRLAKFLHRLHGTSGTYGFDQVSGLAHELREAVAARPVRILDESLVEPLLAALLEASLGQEATETAVH
jgi:HPt (histidine-containing phosphotransfer) domain-containing protein